MVVFDEARLVMHPGVLHKYGVPVVLLGEGSSLGSRYRANPN